MNKVFFLPFIILIASCYQKNEPEKKIYTIDPLGEDQWYISGSSLNSNWYNINLKNTQYSGQGVLISIVDNGVDIFHEDLINNIGIGNYSYLPNEYIFSNADHGTSVAGIIGSEKGNGIGGYGIAPSAKMIAYNPLKAPAISNLADALIRNKEKVWISNNSWGDFNSWGEPLALRSLIRSSLEEGVNYGRNGKGIIYIFSAGNGASEQNILPSDNVNYSGLVNNRYTIPVCSIDENGIRAKYSEVGATLLICAPSMGGSGLGITTTDVTGELGYNPEIFPEDYENNNYTKNFSGTSASAPMVTGVVALMLEANPKLGWRDVRAILAYSAKINHISDPDWVENSAGLKVNHKYGFGVVDAESAIKLSQSWDNYPDNETIEGTQIVNIAIPDNTKESLVGEIEINRNLNVEFIDIFLNVPDHSKIGDLKIVLISPSMSKSVLAEQHIGSFDGAFKYNNWRFGSMRHLGEESIGKWKLVVLDKANGNTGTFISWTLKIYGHQKAFL